MTKVTLHDNVAPAAEAPKKPQFESVTDSRGRVIQLRELDPLQQARLVMGVGGEASQNTVWMNGFAIPAAMVAYIDDDFFGFPGTVRQVETMLSILGNEGMAAINSHLMQKIEAAKEAALSAEQAAAKN